MTRAAVALPFKPGVNVRIERSSSIPLAVLVLDLDRLKLLNDAHGHLAGAEAVRTVGRIIAAHLPSDAVACRYGGDEFVIALPRCTETGIGIDPAATPHIFEHFFRADPARSSGVEGAGLGLSLVKWVVDRHHGRIEVESHPGQGSTFTVFFPVALNRPFH